jgi:DNA-binding FadR family transcriptional regulator
MNSPQFPDCQLTEKLRDLVLDSSRADNPRDRLPSERELATLLSTARSKLRVSLSQLDKEGLIWRGVGRGTFVGPKPIEIPDLKQLSKSANPAHVMRARLAIEPELAGLAAANATADEVKELRALCEACESSSSWHDYEKYDTLFHHAIAQAAHNPVLSAFINMLNEFRRTVNRGRTRAEGRPPKAHHSFSEHRLVLDAISSQNPKQAAKLMRIHLVTVEDRLLGRR